MAAKFELGSLFWRVTGETKDFDKSLTSAEKKANKFADQLKKVGKNLTKFVTLPLIGIGVASIKAASDLGESINAVNVVFGDAADAIHEFGEVSAESVGLSQNAFNALATSTGALLKQTGLDLDTVAQSTIDLSRRAADTASVFNTTVDDALESFNAALRGEAEPARRFGVNLSDAAVQAEALSSGLVSSANEITDQIKVQARYNLIMQQSAQFAGDFNNTLESLPNQTRVLRADLVDLGAELGEAFIPLVTDTVGKIRDAVEWFGELDDSTQKTIIRMGIFAAASGPIAQATSQIIKLSTAIKAMNASVLFGPVGLIVGLAAVTAGLVVLGRRRREAQIDELEVEFADLADELGVATDGMREFAQKAEAVDQALVRGSYMATFESTAEQVQALAENLDLTQEAVIAIGLESENVSDTYKELLEQVGEGLNLRNEELEVAMRSAATYERFAEAQRDAVEAMEEQLRIQRELDAIAAPAREEAERRYSQLLEELDAQDDIARIELERARAIDELGESYVRSGLAVDLLNEYYDRLVGQQQALQREELQTAADAEVALLMRANSLDDFYDYQEEKRKENEEAEEKSLKQMVNLWSGAFNTIGGLATTGLGLVAQALDAQLEETTAKYDELLEAAEESYNAQVEAMEERYQAELEAAGVAEQTALEKARAELEAAIAANDAEAISEARLALKKAEIDAVYAAQRAALDEQYAAQEEELRREQALAEWRLQVEQFRVQKSIDRINAALATAQAAIQAYRALAGIPVVGPGLAVAAAAAATAFGLRQQQLIASQPQPQRPSFAYGTEYITAGRQEIVVGDNPGGRELVQVTPLSSPNINGPKHEMTFIFELDGKIFAEAAANYYNKGKVRLRVGQ